MSTPSAASEQPDDAPPSPFHRLADFLALPRLGGLALSADGTRLAISVATLDAGEEEVAVRAVGGRPGRARRGPAADPQRPG